MRVGRVNPRSDVYSLYCYPYPIEIESPTGDSIFLSIDQSLKIVEDPLHHKQLKFKTLSYTYGISDAPEAERFLYWHWDPYGSEWDYPHVHAGVQDPGGRGYSLHIPTGARVSIEQVVTFLIREGFAIPRVDEWQEILSDGQRRFRDAQR